MTCHTTPATGTLRYLRWGSDLGLVLAIFVSKLFQNEAEAEFTGLMNTTDEIVTAVADTKIKDDDIDLALDALRNCDTDFIKFDEVFNLYLFYTL